MKAASLLALLVCATSAAAQPSSNFQLLERLPLKDGPPNLFENRYLVKDSIKTKDGLTEVFELRRYDYPQLFGAAAYNEELRMYLFDCRARELVYSAVKRYRGNQVVTEQPQPDRQRRGFGDNPKVEAAACAAR